MQPLLVNTVYCKSSCQWMGQHWTRQDSESSCQWMGQHWTRQDSERNVAEWNWNGCKNNKIIIRNGLFGVAASAGLCTIRNNAKKYNVHAKTSSFLNTVSYSDRKCYWKCARLYGMNDFLNLSVRVCDSSNAFAWRSRKNFTYRQ